MKIHPYVNSVDPNRIIGFTFFCPGCKTRHAVQVVGPTTWSYKGGPDNPTFSPSVLVTHDTWEPPVTPKNVKLWRVEPWDQHRVMRICHSFITDGRIQFLNDCTHELAGQTVDLPDL